MYDKIVNPLTGRYVSVRGTIGRTVLQNYLKQFGGTDPGNTYSSIKDGFILKELGIKHTLDEEQKDQVLDMNVLNMNESEVVIRHDGENKRDHTSTHLINYINNKSGIIPKSLQPDISSTREQIFSNIRKETKRVGSINEYGKTILGDNDLEKDKTELNNTMFLYGKPTENIMNILLGLNKVRNQQVGFNNLENENFSKKISAPFKLENGKTKRPWPPSPLPGHKLKFMTGFIEVAVTATKYIIYTTISDKMDDEFIEKLRLYIECLNKSGYHVIFDKDEVKLMEMETKLGHISRLFKTYLKSEPYSNNLKLKDSNQKARERAESNVITFVFDVKNIVEGTLTVPFKKTKEVEVFCNNGSTCAESKLFGFFKTLFVKENSKKGVVQPIRGRVNPISKINGSIAVWFRNNNDGDNFINSYCYDELWEDGDRNTVKLMLNMLNMFNMPGFKKLNETETFDEMVERLNVKELEMVDAARSFALPCPGCQKNYFNYLHMVRHKWDSPHKHNTASTCSFKNIAE